MNMGRNRWRQFYELKARAADADSPTAVCYASSAIQGYLVEGFRYQGVGNNTRISILDGGCGNGTFKRSLFSDHPVFGFDLSFGMCRLAAQQGVISCCADAANLPFADGQFDLVYSPEMLQHIDDLRAVIAELGRVCRPGGRIVISTGNRRSLVRAMVIFIRKIFPRRDAAGHPPIILRTAADIVAAAGPLRFGSVCWTHSPFRWVYHSKRLKYLFEPLASNAVVELLKSTS
jgi:SAM-dependent methyltransferase